MVKRKPITFSKTLKDIKQIQTQVQPISEDILKLGRPAKGEGPRSAPRVFSEVPPVPKEQSDSKPPATPKGEPKAAASEE